MAIEQEQPIEPALKELMNDIGKILGRAIAEHTHTAPGERYGFALFMFGLAGDELSRMNYICNCNRQDMLTALKEFIARAEGRYQPDFTKRRPV